MRRLHCAPATHISINAARPSWGTCRELASKRTNQEFRLRKTPGPTRYYRNNSASSPFVVDGDFRGARRLPNPELTQGGTSSEALYPPDSQKKAWCPHRRIGAPRQTVATVLVLAVFDAFATAATQKILALGSLCESVHAAFARSSLRARRLGNPAQKSRQGLKCLKPAVLRNAISWLATRPSWFSGTFRHQELRRNLAEAALPQAVHRA